MLHFHHAHTSLDALLVHLSAWYAPAFYFVVALSSMRIALPQARAEWSRNGFVLILVQLLFLLLHSPRAAGGVTLLIAAWGAAFMCRSAITRNTLHRTWEDRFSGTVDGISLDPVVLEAPFTGGWKAVSGGSDAAKNHHFAASPQWFAYDFVRMDEATLGSEVLSPVDGVVVGIQNSLPDRAGSRFRKRSRKGHPAGNFVLLQLARRQDVFVLLAHLQRGSVKVAIGENVSIGRSIGRCGTSGDTSSCHLHIHAQWIPAEKLNNKGVGEPMQWSAKAVPMLLLQNGKPSRILLNKRFHGRVA